MVTMTMTTMTTADAVYFGYFADYNCYSLHRPRGKVECKVVDVAPADGNYGYGDDYDDDGGDDWGDFAGDAIPAHRLRWSSCLSYYSETS